MELTKKLKTTSADKGREMQEDAGKLRHKTKTMTGIEVFPGHMGYIILPASSGSTFWYPPTWQRPADPHKKKSSGRPNVMPEPPWLTLF